MCERCHPLWIHTCHNIDQPVSAVGRVGKRVWDSHKACGRGGTLDSPGCQKSRHSGNPELLSLAESRVASLWHPFSIWQGKWDKKEGHFPGARAELDQILSFLKSSYPPHPYHASALLPFYSIPCYYISSLTKPLPVSPTNSLVHSRPYLAQALLITGSAHSDASPPPW